MKVILVAGVVAIAATYFLTRIPTEEAISSSDAAYEQQLADLRKKQKINAEEKSTYSALNNPTSATSTQPADQTSLSDHLKQQMNSTLQSLGQMLPSNKQLPAEVTETQSRISYLQSLPTAVIEATPRPAAVSMARQDAGRQDPFADLGNPPPFPRSNGQSGGDSAISGAKLPSPNLGSGPEGMPPPPPGADLPPPPPPGVSAQLTPPPGISLEELPPPPEKPLLMKKLKLNGIVGDRVILTFKDRRYQRRNGYKKYITLAQGQQFDSVTLVAVENDKAVLEEDGQQTTVRLDAIR